MKININEVIVMDEGWGEFRLQVELEAMRQCGSEEDLLSVMDSVAEAELLDYFDIREEYEKLKKKLRE